MDLPRNTQITTPNDADLLQDFVAQRCERAFATLVDRYQHLVMSVCLRQTHHRHDAEDAFQATFQVLSENAVHLKNPASLSGWLATTAYRISLGIVRRRLREPDSLTLDPALPAADLRHSERRAAELALDEAINQLPEKHRDVIVRFYLLEQTGREIAGDLQVTQGVVDGLVKRGRQMLRLHLVRRGITLGAALWIAEAAVRGAPANFQQVRAVMTKVSADWTDHTLGGRFRLMETEPMHLIKFLAAGTGICTTAAVLLMSGLLAACTNWNVAGPGSPLVTVVASEQTPLASHAVLSADESQLPDEPNSSGQLQGQEPIRADATPHVGIPRVGVPPAAIAAMMPRENTPYRLHAKDRLSISCPYPDLASDWPGTFVVADDGTILIPRLGRVKATGRTINELCGRLRKHVHDVDVALQQFGTTSVVVLLPDRGGSGNVRKTIHLKTNRADVLTCLHDPVVSIDELAERSFLVYPATVAESSRHPGDLVDGGELIEKLSAQKPRVQINGNDVPKLRSTILADNDVLIVRQIARQFVPAERPSSTPPPSEDCRNDLPVGARIMMSRDDRVRESIPRLRPFYPLPIQPYPVGARNWLTRNAVTVCTAASLTL